MEPLALELKRARERLALAVAALQVDQQLEVAGVEAADDVLRPAAEADRVGVAGGAAQQRAAVGELHSAASEQVDADPARARAVDPHVQSPAREVVDADPAQRLERS